MDDAKRIKFEKINGRIKYAKKAYRQFIIRGFNLTVTGLSFGRAYNNEFLFKDDKGTLVRHGLFQREVPVLDRSFDQKDSRTRLYVNGTAKISKDTLGVIGDPENTTKQLELTFEELPESNEDFARFAWKASIYFFPAHWESGTPDTWCISVYVPTAIFRDLVMEAEETQQRALSIRLDTDLWTDEGDYHTPPVGEVQWYLAPDEEGRLDRAPQTAHGVVASMGLSDKVSGEDANQSVIINPSKTQANFREVINALYAVAGAIVFLAVVIYWKQ